MSGRQLNPADAVIVGLDRALRTMFATPLAGRPNPASADRPVTDEPLSADESRRSGALMRVNHAGEVCAQALYQGQGMTARRPRLRRAMQQASDEENDHLAWCQARLDELGEPRSRLTAVWFVGSFALGSLAGSLGDRWSLGFLAETERQVVRHLEGHLLKLPASDWRSRRIVTQMKTDEGQHANRAMRAGGRELPGVVRKAMHCLSRVMTTTAARF